MKPRFIGLMSGTSMDGVDVALVEFDNDIPKLIGCHSHPITEPLLSHLHQLADPSFDSINQLGRMDRAVGQLFAEATNTLLAELGIAANSITAIGSHGQTVRHFPEGKQGFSIQIGDPNTIAVNTGIDVVHDFRSKDIALGGQGAPLVPAFHHILTSPKCEDDVNVILNIGGIANISYLTKDQIIGFDTGPGNALMDAWCRRTLKKPYDENGALAARGKVLPALLDKLKQHPYFAMPYPKSTGRELFNLAWLEQHLEHFANEPPENIQATLCQLTADTISDAISWLSPKGNLYVCGGGALNPVLIDAIAKDLPDYKVQSSSALGVDPQWMEAMAFAWFAKCHIERQPGNVVQVTGASRPAVLGSFTPHS
ncbi:anhydro-N-acetylmuramic acid kinase [Paraferrimonas sp. SM1919]|uniref:anhydro-N-acetylmuramic acid kinase n=1 Tax=Paraferrimonas sp. SM1919 TaxID=2662263 RepID=UPI0013D78CC7|nr:anhydro-N-acetylmuramic acid kinase [Paraferrimonas sp. SM1919]